MAEVGDRIKKGPGVPGRGKRRRLSAKMNLSEGSVSVRSSGNVEPPSRKQIMLAAGAFEGGLLLLWLLLGSLLDRPPSAQGEATAGALAWGVLGTLPLLPLLTWVSVSRWAPVRRLMAEVDEVLVPYLSRLSLTDFAVIALLAGVGEEGLFRGLLQGALVPRILPLPAILVSSAAFGLLHLITPAYAILAGIIGLYLGVISFLSGNVVIPMVIHVLYDFAALVYLVRWRRRQPDEGTQG
jgi:membrane protease YdiL (CAAX protease family)